MKLHGVWIDCKNILASLSYFASLTFSLIKSYLVKVIKSILNHLCGHFWDYWVDLG